MIDEETLAYNVTLRSRGGGGIVRRRPVSGARLESVLDGVGLAGRERDRASVLLGGEKQRAGVARAIYKKAAYIFADEPTASLDADNRRVVTELLTRSAAAGACVVIATHDEALASIADVTCQL